MKVITFQNYLVARELNEKGVFKSNVRRDWVESKTTCKVVDKLVEKYNELKEVHMDNPVFGVTRINLEISEDLCCNLPKYNLIKLNDIGVDDIAPLYARYTNFLDNMVNTDTLTNGSVLICLDVPDNMVLEYSQTDYNDMVFFEDMYNWDKVLEVKEEGVTSCILPYIKKEWVTGVYVFTFNVRGDLVTLKANNDINELELYKAFNHDIGHGITYDVTDLVDRKEYSVYETLEKHNAFNGWMCKDVFDKDLFLEYISKKVLLQKGSIKKYEKYIDENDIYNSMLKILRESYNDL